MSTHDEMGILTLGSEPIYWLLGNAGAPATTLMARPDDLSEDEWDYYRSLKIDKRRWEWLLGRRAAKRLVNRLLQALQGRQLPPDQIVILPHADGWPMVSLPGDHQPALTLSISHSHNYAFCAAVARRDYALGVDIEYVEPRSEDFIVDYFTLREREFLAVAPQEQRDFLSNAIWSGKEAALKAIRRGLAEDTRSVSCLPHPTMGTGDAWLPMPIIWHSSENAPKPALSGYWRPGDNFVLTLAATNGSG